MSVTATQVKTAQHVKSLFRSLAKPLELANGVVLKNRIVMSSMTRTRAVPEDYVNDTIVDYYTQRAAGGAGLILTEGALVSMQGTEYPNVPSIYSEKHVEGWKKVVDAVHAAGVPIICQLWHVGRVAHPEMPYQKKAGTPVSAPSAVAARGGKFRLLGDAGYVEAPAHPDPWKLVDEFKQSAQYAKAAGFDGVELHGAAGYLVQQFIDNTANIRTDQWGGSAENRARFAVECLKAMAGVFGASSCGIKLSPCGGMNDIGMSKEDTIESYGYVIKEAVKLGLGYINFMRYMPFTDAEYDGKLRACQLDVLTEFGPLVRASGGKTKLFLNGDLTTKEAEDLVESGQIDAAIFGRPFLNNPDFPHRTFQGLPLNEDLGFPINYYNLYNFDKDITEGFNTYPTVEVAMKSHSNGAGAA